MSKKVFQTEYSIKFYYHDSVYEGTFGKRSRFIDRLAVILRPPRGVIDSAVQHPHAADAGVKSLCQHAMPISQNELNATATTSLEPGSRIGIFFPYVPRGYGYVPPLRAVPVPELRLHTRTFTQGCFCNDSTLCLEQTAIKSVQLMPSKQGYFKQ